MQGKKLDIQCILYTLDWVDVVYGNHGIGDVR